MQDFVFLKKSVNIYYYRVYKESQYSYKILWCLKSCLSSDVQLNTCTGIKHQNQSIYHDSCFSVHNIPCALHIDILWIRNWSSVIYLFYNWITRFLLYGHLSQCTRKEPDFFDCIELFHRESRNPFLKS